MCEAMLFLHFELEFNCVVLSVACHYVEFALKVLYYTKQLLSHSTSVLLQ